VKKTVECGGLEVNIGTVVRYKDCVIIQALCCVPSRLDLFSGFAGSSLSGCYGLAVL